MSIALATLLAACTTGGGVIYYRSIESTSIGMAVGHLRGSQVVLVVRGNPLGIDQAAFDALVANALHGANPGTAATFVPEPAETAQGGRRIILVLNGPAGSNGFVMCGGIPPEGGAPEVGGHVRVLAAFCGSDDRPLSYVAAGIDGVTGPNDEQFLKFLRQVVHYLLPMEDPDFRPDHDRDRREWPI